MFERFTDRAREVLAVAQQEARANGVTLDAPDAQVAIDRLVLAAVERTLVDPSRLGEVHGVLLLAASLGMEPVVGRAQELVYDAVTDETNDRRDDLLPLASALGVVL